MSEMDWTRPIDDTNVPPGAEVHSVGYGPSTLPVIGRLVVDGVPCLVEGGCGEKASAVLLRCPTSGMNRPGEPSQVAEVRICRLGCRLLTALVDADEQERAWGWDHDTVV